MPRPVVSVVVSALALGCLVWVFHGIDFHALVLQLAAVRWLPFLAAVVFNLAIYAANAVRWQVLLEPVADVGFWRALEAGLIGVFVDDVLPLRPGEVVRCVVLAERSDATFVSAASSLALARMLEAGWLELGFLAVIPFVPVPPTLIYVSSAVALVLLAVSTLTVIAVKRSGASGEEGGFWLTRTWHQAARAWRLMGNVRTLLVAAGLTLVAFLLYVLAAWAALGACGIPLPLAAASAVVILLRIGTAFPSTPASVGVYQFFAVVALRLFGISKTAATAYAVVAFAAFTIPVIAVGTFAFVRTGVQLSDLLLRARERRAESDSAGDHAP